MSGFCRTCAPRIPGAEERPICAIVRCPREPLSVLSTSIRRIAYAYQVQPDRGRRCRARRGRRVRAGHGGQDRPRRPRLRRPGALRQGQRKRRPHGGRGSERQGRDDRRQEGQARAGRRRRRGRSEAGHGGGAEAVRRQGQRRGRPPQLGHHHPGLEDLQRLRHSRDHALGDEPEVFAAGLQDRLPHPRQRQRARRRARRCTRPTTCT